MTKIIQWTMTQGENVGFVATTYPANQSDLALTRPEVAEMTEDEYIQFIIQKDVMPNNPSNVEVIDAQWNT